MLSYLWEFGGRSKKNIKTMSHSFKARIYKTGINWAVDVPRKISDQLEKEKGYIRVKGAINGFEFKTTLVPVKEGPYRLFVNGIMMKGGATALGKIASFTIEQNRTKLEEEYKIPEALKRTLIKEKLTSAFEALRPSRKKDILKYLHYIKTEETLLKNIDKVILQLKANHPNTRIP